MSNPKTWKWKRDGTAGYGVRLRIGRLQIGGRLMRHRYPRPESPDRWVLQPDLVYDRKPDAS